MSNYDDKNENGYSFEPDGAPQSPETNYQGDENMSDSGKVKFDSIFNPDDDSSRRAYTPATDAVSENPGVRVRPDEAPPVYAPSAVPPAYPPYPYAGYSDMGMEPRVSYTAKKPTGKEKVSFKAKAALVCVASVLGFMTLGLGLSLGGALANRLLPPNESAERSESVTSQPEVYTYSQPKVEFSESQFTPGISNVSGIVKKVSDAVVSINLSVSVPNFFNQATEQPGAGSGIIFSEDEENVFVATNNHVIQSADHVTISVDDKTHVDAHFVGSDPQSDLAVISVKKSDMADAAIAYTLADFGDSSLLQVGDEVVAIGNAMGEGKTATSGIISAINKQISIDGKKLDVIQTDAAINRGNSGGALANGQGEVIGINTAKLSASDVEGMGYSIPSNIAKTILEDLKVNGSAKKPYLGIQGMSITEEIKNMYNLPSLGVYVDAVTAGGAAEQAGIEATDIIIGFNDTKITTIDELSSAIAEANVGDKATVYIYRQVTHPMQFEVVLGNLNPDANF
ncbi:MAG: trypsin-like peptidase domain-containing protein [Clostridiales bacterium]|jgi:serine protease Do|nr:trypsin-like peptidase domain-containing protein [Clostridiales bacterium]